MVSWYNLNLVIAITRYLVVYVYDLLELTLTQAGFGGARLKLLHTERLQSVPAPKQGVHPGAPANYYDMAIYHNVVAFSLSQHRLLLVLLTLLFSCSLPRRRLLALCPRRCHGHALGRLA
jgi:hypothetical protein